MKMKNPLLTTLLVTLTVSAPLAWADWAQHADNYMELKVVMTENDKQVQMDKMQENMLRMHEQMHKIAEVKNPQEREKLLKQHSKMMQGMMGGCGMMGTDGKSGKMDGGMKGM